jgi:hypothetical protein
MLTTAEKPGLQRSRVGNGIGNLRGLQERIGHSKVILARKLPDRNPECLLSMCYLLADQGILHLPWYSYLRYIFLHYSWSPNPRIHVEVLCIWLHLLTESVTNSKCLTLSSGNRHLCFVSSDRVVSSYCTGTSSVLTLRRRGSYQLFLESWGYSPYFPLVRGPAGRQKILQNVQVLAQMYRLLFP